MIYAYSKDKITINLSNKENCPDTMIIEEENSLSIVENIVPREDPLVITDSQESIVFLSTNSVNKQPKANSRIATSHKLKNIKLSQESYLSNDSEFLAALDDFEKEHNDLLNDEVYQIIQKEENLFKITSVRTNDDDLSDCLEILASFGVLNTDGDVRCRLKLIQLKHAQIKTDKVFSCVMTGTWADTNVEPNDEVQIFGKFCKETLAILIQNSMNEDNSIFNYHFIIVEPSILLHPTAITSSFPCYRKSVLSSYIGGRDEASLPMTKGIFEQLSTSSELALNPEKLEEIVQGYIEANLDIFYALKTDMDAFIKQLQLTAKKAQEWVLAFFKDQNDLILTNGKKESKLKVLQVVNAEQMLTASNLGLKGKTDLILLCEVTTTTEDGEEKRRAFVPFELKTGEREVTTYNTQTLLYCILVMQKYNQYEGVNGLLYYMSMNKLIEIRWRNFEVFPIIQRRNTLAKHHKNYEQSKGTTRFPPMINSAHECNRCYQNLACALINLTIEDKPTRLNPNKGNKKRLFSSKSLPDIEDFHIDPAFQRYYEVEKMLDPTKKVYLKKWFNFLHIEEMFEIDTKNVNENKDPNFYMIELDNFDELREIVKLPNNNETPRMIMLKFSKSFEDKDSINAFLDGIKQMDYVSLIQSSLSCTLKGNVMEKRMKKNKQQDKKYYIGCLIIRCYLNDSTVNSEKLEYVNSNEMQTLWRMEKSRKNFFPLMRFNMLELIINPQNNRMYQLIVQLQPPQFEENKEALKPFEMLYKKKKKTNEDQINTIQKCLLAKDYNLVLGMPGTGKTFVIVMLLRILIERGDQILLSSFTHSAIDGILKRFVEQYPTYRDKVVRISSNANQVDESVRDLVYQKRKFKNVKEIDTYFKSKQIFAVTCLAVTNLVFSNRKFDICIIDEASQALEPVALGPILLAKKFILFGDHYQLQPLVKSKEAQEKGMQISLFERLINHNPSAVSMLSFQYRMNEDIMHISNTLIYDNRLKIDNPLVSQSSIDIPFVKLIYDKKWLINILNPERRVIFLNLDCIDSLKKVIYTGQKSLEGFTQYEDSFYDETKDETSRNSSSVAVGLLDEKGQTQVSAGESNSQVYSDCGSNKLDLKLAIYMTKTLLNCGVKPEDIAVITPLNYEKNYIQSKLNKSKVEVFTVDKSQGIDKSCVIINLSLENKGKEFLLTNPRRINVAFTRAKQKLIVIGSISNLQKIENMNKFIDIIVAKRWVYNMEDHMMDIVNEKKYDELANKSTAPSKFGTQ